MAAVIAVDERDPQAGTPTMPERIGRFVVREEIGRGSNGVVYSATDPVLGRELAIKAIPLNAQYPGHEEMEQGFLQEAKIAAGLNHPSIVTVFDAGKTDTLAYIAMERLKGADLHQWLANNRSMSAENAAALIARVADAVHFAHRRGLIHRDIKPSNIFLGRDMKPKVLDFGIALAQGQQGGPDTPKKLIGTPNYMSPEQALARPLDARSDVFSIGAILYELITGHRAFDGASIDEILSKVVKIDPPNVTSWRPEVSPVMGEIVLRALAKEPANRYQTAAQLRNDLAAFAGRPVGPATTPAGSEPLAPPAPPEKLPPASNAAMISTAVAVAGLSLTFALWYTNSHNDANPPAPSPTAIAPLRAPALPPGPAEVAPGAAAALPAPVPAVGDGASTGASGGSDLAPASPANAAKPIKHAAAPARPASRATAPVAEAAPAIAVAAPTEPGTLTLAIVPWGQVVVDGRDAGVAPPLNRIDLSPGTHTIEVRNGGATPLVTQVQIESGKTLALQYRF
jgi:serine/threonine-protein kinase